MKHQLRPITWWLATFVVLFLRDAWALPNEVWIGLRSDLLAGAGTIGDPYDGSTQAKFDEIMTNDAKTPTNICIHLGAGTFITNGVEMKEGWWIDGVSQDLTIIKLADNRQTISNSSSNCAVLRRWDFEGILAKAHISNMTLDCNRDRQPVYANGVTRGRSFTATTDGSAIVRAATAGFASADIGLSIEGAGIPPNTTIQSVTNTTTVTMTASATRGTPTVTISGKGTLTAFAIHARVARVDNIRGLGTWSNPGEGFPMLLYTSGDATGTTNRLEIENCENVSPRGYLTAISAADQTGGKFSGFIKSCSVLDGPKANGYGSGGWSNFSVVGNMTLDCAAGVVIDTHNYENVLLEGNFFIRTRAYGILANGNKPGQYKNIAIKNNVVEMTASNPEGGGALYGGLGTWDIQGNTFSCLNPVAAALNSFSNARGIIANNTINEIANSDLGRACGLAVSNNRSADGRDKSFTKTKK